MPQDTLKTTQSELVTLALPSAPTAKTPKPATAAPQAPSSRVPPARSVQSTTASTAM